MLLPNLSENYPSNSFLRVSDNLCYITPTAYEEFQNYCIYEVGSLIFNPCSKTCSTGYSEFTLIKANYGTELYKIAYHYIYPILALLTMITHLFLVLILGQKRMKSPTNVVLLYLGLADLMLALVPFSFFFFWFIVGYNKVPDAINTFWCNFSLYTNDVIPIFCHNVAVWLTVLLAAQRVVTIRYTNLAYTWCTIRNMHIVTFVIMTISLLFILPSFIDISDIKMNSWTAMELPSTGVNNTNIMTRGKLNSIATQSLLFIADNGSSNSLFTNNIDINTTVYQAEHSCVVTFSSIVDSIGTHTYFSSYYWSRAILFSLIPCILLTILSIMLIQGLKDVGRRRARLHAGNFNGRGSNPNVMRSSERIKTVMLICIVGIFLLVNLPQCINLSLFCIAQTFQWYIIDPQTTVMISNVDNLLILASYPLNFGIYLSMSEQIRQRVATMFTCRRSRAHNYISVSNRGRELVVSVTRSRNRRVATERQITKTQSTSNSNRFSISRAPLASEEIYDSISDLPDSVSSSETTCMKNADDNF